MKVKDMQIYLVDINTKMIESWEKYFKYENNVNVICSDIYTFLVNKNIDCIVSPANSFGIMDGGIDLELNRYFSNNVNPLFQQMVINMVIDDRRYAGQIPLGEAALLKIGKKYFIACPTMILPELLELNNDNIATIRKCMKNCLIKAMENNIKSIFIPAFGAGTGGIPEDIVAQIMYDEYKKLK